jgi:hypothetical protein
MHGEILLKHCSCYSATMGITLGALVTKQAKIRRPRCRVTTPTTRHQHPSHRPVVPHEHRQHRRSPTLPQPLCSHPPNRGQTLKKMGSAMEDDNKEVLVNPNDLDKELTLITFLWENLNVFTWKILNMPESPGGD